MKSKDNSITTITIDSTTLLKIDKLSKSCKMSKKDFISATVNYLEKYGINPSIHEPPGGEMQKIIKRIDQIVAFIREQEKTILRPAIINLFESEHRTLEKISHLVSSEDLRTFKESLEKKDLENKAALINISNKIDSLKT